MKRLDPLLTTVLCLTLSGLAPAQQPPVVPEGYVLVDDMIVPEGAFALDSGFSGTPWPGGVVYYTFDSGVAPTDADVAIDAMDEWAASANVTFTPRTTQPNWINFVNGTANTSFVGMVGGMQNITILNWNYRFIVCHEIAHALGCFHEQQRSDRDTYVTIQSANILAPNAGNFTLIPGGTLYGPYDFDSLMHYDQFAFSSNGLPTIVCKPGYTGFQSTMGQRAHMSVRDSLGMATRYGVAPAPILAGIAPTFVVAGSASFTLFANCARVHRGTTDGLGVAASRLTWNGTPVTTTYMNRVIQTAVIPPSLLTTAGYATVRIDNPYPCSGPSAPVTFEIRNPVPTITTVNPSTVAAGSAGATITVSGTNFTTQSVVRWNGNALTTTFSSSTALTAAVPSTLVATAGNAFVTVFNPTPGGGTTGTVSVGIVNPVPVIASISPSSKFAGSASFTLTVTYTAAQVYTPQSVVRWNGTALPTTYAGTQLLATVGAGLIAAPGTASVTVFNPAPGGGTSNAVTFSTILPAPVLTSITPDSALFGGSAFTLTATGTSFTTASVIRWNGSSLTTTYVSATQLSASVAASLIATAGTASVTVQTPAPGGGTSAARTFTIENPVPIVTSLSPTSKLAGSVFGSFNLNVAGTGFLAQSVVRWNGANRPTTFISATQLRATIDASLVQTAASVPITVDNPLPGGGTSNAVTFTVNNPAPSISSVNPASLNAGAGATTLTAYGSNLSAQTVLRWNGVGLPTTYTALLFPHVTATAPATLIDAPAVIQITLFNPAPGGGETAPETLVIHAPVITGITPPSIPVLGTGSSPVTVSVATQHVAAGATVFANGTAVATTSGAANVSVPIGPALAQATLPGGIAITIEKGPQAISNSMALVVGGGNNAGTIVTHPSSSPLAPGTPFDLVIEGGVVGAPFSLLIDASTAPVVTGFPNAAADLVLAVGTAELICPIDGMGLFQPAAAFAVLQPTSGPSGAGFTLPGLTSPNPPLGISRTLQVIYVDPTSASGFRLGWAASPRSL